MRAFYDITKITLLESNNRKKKSFQWPIPPININNHKNSTNIKKIMQK